MRVCVCVVFIFFFDTRGHLDFFLFCFIYYIRVSDLKGEKKLSNHSCYKEIKKQKWKWKTRAILITISVMSKETKKKVKFIFFFCQTGKKRRETPIDRYRMYYIGLDFFFVFFHHPEVWRRCLKRDRTFIFTYLNSYDEEMIKPLAGWLTYWPINIEGPPYRHIFRWYCWFIYFFFFTFALYQMTFSHTHSLTHSLSHFYSFDK